MSPQESPIGRWLRAQGGGTHSWCTPIQIQVALALVDPAAPRGCPGRVAVTLDGSWTCSAGCDGPPRDRHEPDHVALCIDGLTTRRCPCPRCRPDAHADQ